MAGGIQTRLAVAPLQCSHGYPGRVVLLHPPMHVATMAALPRTLPGLIATIPHAGYALFGTHAMNTVYPVHHTAYSTIYLTCVHYTTTAPPAWNLYWRPSSTP